MDWYIDLEISLAKTLGWSLYEIDETDIDSLLPFVIRLNSRGPGIGSTKYAFCDQVNFL